MTRSNQVSPPTMSTQIVCTVTDIASYNRNREAIAHFKNGESMTLSATVIFSDTAHDALVTMLMSGCLTLKTTFYARQHHSAQERVLGSVMTNTMKNVLSYPLELDLPRPEDLGLVNNMTYQVGATARVGIAPYGTPNVMRGHLNERCITIGNPVSAKEPAQDSPNELALPEEENTINVHQVRQSNGLDDDQSSAPAPDCSEEKEVATAPKPATSRRKRTKKTA